MKKFLIVALLLAFGLFMGTCYALNAPAMQGGNPDRHYIEVEYNLINGIDAGHGTVLEWDLDSATGETLGYSVHACDADNCEYIAGVVPAYNDYSMNLDYLGRPLEDGDVFMMQIWGHHAAVQTDTSLAEGECIDSDAGTYGFKDGDGAGFAFKAYASDATTEYTARGQYYVPVFLRIGDED